MKSAAKSAARRVKREERSAKSVLTGSREFPHFSARCNSSSFARFTTWRQSHCNQFIAANGQFPQVPGSSRTFHKFSHIPESSRRFSASSRSFPQFPASSRRLPQVLAGSCKLSQVAASSSRSPQIPAGSRRFPQVPVDSRRFPQIPASSRRGPRV